MRDVEPKNQRSNAAFVTVAVEPKPDQQLDFVTTVKRRMLQGDLWLQMDRVIINPTTAKKTFESGIFFIASLLFGLRKCLINLQRSGEYESVNPTDKNDEIPFLEIISNDSKDIAVELVIVKYDHDKKIFFDKEIKIIVITKKKTYNGVTDIKTIQFSYPKELKPLIKNLQKISEKIESLNKNLN